MQSTQAGGSATKGGVSGRKADRQTEPECQRSLPSPLAPCVFCVLRASRAEEAEEPVYRYRRPPLPGRSAVAERASGARITHSTGRAVRVARDSRRCAEVRLFAFETTSLAVARRRSPRSTRSPSSRSRCRVEMHDHFPSQAATSPCKNTRGRGQPARRRTTRQHTPSSIPSHEIG